MPNLRVSLIQPALPHYRIALFRELARRESIDLHVYYGQETDLPNVAPEGFHGTYAPQQPLLGGTLYWQEAHFALASKSKSDVWVANWNTRYWSVLPAIAKAKLNGVGTVLWGHGYSKQESALRLAARTRLGLLADANLFYDQRTVRSYVERGAKEERLFVARNALDQREMRAAQQRLMMSPGALNAFCAAEAVDPKKLLLFVARLTEERRLDVLLHAIKALGDPELKLVVIGGGPHQEPMKRLAEALNIGSQLRWLPALYSEDDLAPWFMSARAMCFPSAIGLSIHHAFAYGLPVIMGDMASRHNPEIEAFSSGENGLTFKHDDSASLAEVLGRYLADPNQRRSLSAGALATAEEYSIDAAVNGFTSAIQYAAQCARKG